MSHIDFELDKRGWTGDVPTRDDSDAFAFILAATGRVDCKSLRADAPIDIYAA